MIRYFLFFIFIIQLNATLIKDSTLSDNYVIIDTKTLLMWQDDNDAKFDNYNWEDAISHCENLTKKGFSDWRLPNINELETIIDDSLSSPALSGEFSNVSNSKYWSSTTFIDTKTKAWHIDFNSAEMDHTNKTNTLNVRCVRDL